MDENKQRFITARGIVITGWVLLILICLIILCANVIMWIKGMDVPNTLENWGATVMGFLFGTFASIIKSFIEDENSR